MPAGSANIYIEQGASWSAIITALQADGSPVKLDGFTVGCQIRPEASSSTVLATVTAVVIDANNGKIKLSLTPLQTAAIPTDGKSHSDVVDYVYDVYIYDGVGGALRVLNGIAQVSPGTTRI